MLASDGGSAEVIHALIIIRMTMIGISGVGLIRAMRPGGDAPLEARSTPHGFNHAAFGLQRKGVFVFHMA